jgi:hypothetical protein
MIPLWNSWERVLGPPIILSESAKHLNRDARKEESVSEVMQLMSWWKLAETICGVSVLLDFPQDSNIGTSLNKNNTQTPVS